MGDEALLAARAKKARYPPRRRLTTLDAVDNDPGQGSSHILRTWFHFLVVPRRLIRREVLLLRPYFLGTRKNENTARGQGFSYFCGIGSQPEHRCSCQRRGEVELLIEMET